MSDGKCDNEKYERDKDDDDEEDVCGDADNEKGCLIMNNFDYPYLPGFCVGA